jgi:hypothetical protein
MWQLSPSRASVPSMLTSTARTVSRSAPDFFLDSVHAAQPDMRSVNGPEYSTLPPVTVFARLALSSHS